MTAFISPPPRLQFFTNAGVPMAGGFLYTYAAGTTTPLTTYTDSSGTIANTNPVILDSRGEASIWLSTVGYKFKLATPANVDVWTQDNISAFPVPSNLISYTPAGTGAVTTTVQTKLRESVSVLDFGAVGDDTADDTAAIQAAITSLSSTGGAIYFPVGRYKVTSPISVTTDQIRLHGDGPRTSVLRCYHNSGVALTVQHASAPSTSFLNGFLMDDIGIRTLVDTTANSCLKLNKAQDVFLTNVSFEDHFGGIEILGGNNIYISRCKIFSPRTSSAPSWAALKVGSFFMKIGKDGGGVGPTEMFVSDFNFRRTESSNYIENGIIINAADGVWFSNGHIMGIDQSCVRVEPVTGVEQITGLKWSNVWFDNNSNYAFYVTGATSGAFDKIEATGCRFYRQSNTGIFVDASATSFAGFAVTGGTISRSGNYGALLRAGASHTFTGVTFGAINTSGGANIAGITVDGGVGKVNASGCVFQQTAYGVTSALMQGVRINAGAYGLIIVSGCTFDLDAAAADISDASTVDTNCYPANITTKLKLATTLAATTLTIAEIGDQFYVTAGLNFSNLSGRWLDRSVTLIFAGASTVTQGSIRMAGSVNFVAKAGDTLTLMNSPDRAFWIETGRMVS